jgi:hypothetical protein
MNRSATLRPVTILHMLSHLTLIWLSQILTQISAITRAVMVRPRIWNPLIVLLWVTILTESHHTWWNLACHTAEAVQYPQRKIFLPSLPTSNIGWKNRVDSFRIIVSGRGLASNPIINHHWKSLLKWSEPLRIIYSQPSMVWSLYLVLSIIWLIWNGHLEANIRSSPVHWLRSRREWCRRN